VNYSQLKSGSGSGYEYAILVLKKGKNSSNYPIYEKSSTFYMSSNKLQYKNDVLPQRIGIAVRDLEVCAEVPLGLQCVFDRVGLLLLLAKLEDRVGVGLAH
jgi:hypothetical protein